MSTPRQSWGIVGGGMLGLALAHKLARAGQDVTVLEAGDRMGGLADAWRIGDVTWDRHYHVILLSDMRLRGLLEDIGLADELRWTTTRSEFYAGGGFHPLTTSVDYLRLPVLGLVDKVRLAGTIVYASRIEDGKALEQIPVETWLRRLSGDRAWRAVWQPLLRAKLGDNWRHASASFIWAIIRRLYAARRTGLKREMFGYVEGGYARVLERLEEALSQAGVDLIRGAKVERIVERDGRIAVEGAGGLRAFDRVVATTPAPVTARLLPGLAAEERQRLEGIRYQGIVCASVLLRKPLNGAYITYITDESVPFTAVIEMSSLVDRAAFGGNTLVYLPWYVPAEDDAAFALSDAEIEQRFLGRLMQMYPALSRADVLAFRVSRVRNVLAISTLDYSARVPRMLTSMPGLYIVNSAQIVNGTLNVNETVKLAAEAGDVLLEDAMRAGREDSEGRVAAAE